MRSFHRSYSARSYFLERGEPSAEKHIQNLVSCTYSFQLVIPSLSRVSLSPHPPGDSHHPLAPPNIIAFIRPGGEPGGDLRVVRKRRFQKQINDARIRNPPWYLDEETRRRWWAGAPWQLRLDFASNHTQLAASTCSVSLGRGSGSAGVSRVLFCGSIVTMPRGQNQ
ncbi:hypothetical protein PVAP13_5NG434900 [Panicum virgatum]|uniref:Uncharacterized protein n=2 Tax=Panicum virgatum TaxID=38727 RepID=A0A8T0S0L6_PANVG|nr:hypothetical protein PVAP13_5NG434900 [Panicum virgatum]KAG2591205.1 hypothetical protein PVAP13_5NG434900 [Panicum virgatum]KAG2591207.1 hypothetical protein PVAP13_5NG434900 [Panicum virgatum]